MKRRVVDGREYSHEILENYRFRAVELYEKRKKINDIAEFFGVHRCVVSHWITTYKRKGKIALKSKKAKGPESKLTKEEMKEILISSAVRKVNSSLLLSKTLPLGNDCVILRIKAAVTGRRQKMSKS